MKKLAALLLSALMLLTLATGCGGNACNASTPSDSQKEEQPPSTDNAGSDLVVGFSTGAAGTTLRQEGIDDFTKVAEEYKAEGRIKDYKIVNNTTNWDANEQANIIRDFINDDEINVIVVNPNSPTDLNGVLAEAVAAGKTVVAADCEVDVEGVYCVSIDHYTWGHKVAEYICEALGGEGNVIQVYGGEGHPANNERIRATADVLKDYPNIKLISSTSGGWDNQTAKNITSQLLGTGQQIGGVITQDSMGYGCLSAFTDLVPRLKMGILKPVAVIGMMDIPGIDEITVSDKGLTLGALANLRKISLDSQLDEDYLVIKEACGHVSSLQVRNIATIGGNACNANPSADAIHGLILNDAMAVIASAEGVREIPILELFAGPGKNTLKQGELLLRFEVPKPAPHTGAAYAKFAIRGDSDIAIVGTGALLTLSDDGTVAKARVSLGAVAPTPIRAAKTEALIAGKKLTDDLIREAAELAATECSPISDQRASREYRLEMVRVWTRHTLEEALKRAQNK